MTKLSKRIAGAAEAREKDYVIWDDELPGFGLRVFASGKRSYLIQYRSAGRSRRSTIGQHGVWTPESYATSISPTQTAGLILGKGGRPKKASPLVRSWRVQRNLEWADQARGPARASIAFPQRLRLLFSPAAKWRHSSRYKKAGYRRPPLALRA